MSVSELKKGKEYYYTAGQCYVRVRYIDRYIGGYRFEGEGVQKDLGARDINNYIEEI